MGSTPGCRQSRVLGVVKQEESRGGLGRRRLCTDRELDFVVTVYKYMYSTQSPRRQYKTCKVCSFTNSRFLARHDRILIEERPDLAGYATKDIMNPSRTPLLMINWTKKCQKCSPFFSLRRVQL